MDGGRHTLKPDCTVLVTGASGGLGAALARRFAEQGFGLTLVARGRDGLEALAHELEAGSGVTVRSIAANLAEPGAAARVWAEATGGGQRVEILVNNAGVGLYGPFAEQDPAALPGMLGLNVVTLTTLTRLALAPMLERRSGRILNVASVVGFQPGGPWMAAYYASKAFVLALSRGLAPELAGTGVTVTALCPGALQSGFEARMEAGYRETLLYRWLASSDIDAVARAGVRGVLKGRQMVVPGLLNKLMAIAGELPPRRLALAVNRRLLKPEGRT